MFCKIYWGSNNFHNAQNCFNTLLLLNRESHFKNVLNLDLRSSAQSNNVRKIIYVTESRPHDTVLKITSTKASVLKEL